MKDECECEYEADWRPNVTLGDYVPLNRRPKRYARRKSKAAVSGWRLLWFAAAFLCLGYLLGLWQQAAQKTTRDGAAAPTGEKR